MTTGLLSIRSWYKPSIHLGEVSPITVKLAKDAEVVDVVKTNKNKEKAKREAIQNTRGRQILKVDNLATKKSAENLQFLIKLSRERINNISELRIINSKVSTETQEDLRRLSNESWNEFKELVKQLPESLENNKYGNYLGELNKLLEFEKISYLEEISKLKSYDQRVKESKESLGNSFFDKLSTVNSEVLFVKAANVQRKLLDLGIVSGLPREQIRKNIRILFPNLSRIDSGLIQDLIDKSTIPNIQIDWQRVQEIEEEAMDNVPNEAIILRAGTQLSQKSQITSEENFYYLKQLNMLHPKPDWQQIINNFLLFAFSIFAFSLIVIFTRLKRFSIQEILMMVLVSSGLSAIIALISLWGINKLVLSPLAALAILLTVFYAPITAGVITTLMSVFLLKSFDLNIWQVLPLFVGAIYAIFLTRKAHQREDLTKAATKIAFAQMIVFSLTIVTAVENFSVLPVLTIALLYGLSGILSGVLSIAVLPYLESGLRLLTPFRLVELSNPNQALLKIIREKAPGTYEHTLSVVNYAEAACRAISGNIELIRVGLLYHDVGKTYKADYFIENQMGKPNPHTTLDDPLESAKIIIEHVPEGVRLCKKYNLPQTIIDYVPMHQGTTVTGYFYQRAIEKFGKENINVQDYRYPGPNPNTKETGIAMLADAIEAALQSIKDTANENDAINMINNIVNARLNEGVLDNTGLSRTELDTIAEAFLRTWKSKHHTRVKYPEQESQKS